MTLKRRSTVAVLREELRNGNSSKVDLVSPASVRHFPRKVQRPYGLVCFRKRLQRMVETRQDSCGKIGTKPRSDYPKKRGVPEPPRGTPFYGGKRGFKNGVPGYPGGDPGFSGFTGYPVFFTRGFSPPVYGVPPPGG